MNTLLRIFNEETFSYAEFDVRPTDESKQCKAQPTFFFELPRTNEIAY